MNAKQWIGAIAGGVALLGVGGIVSADWPQWLGSNRDGKVLGSGSPATWPKGLTRKWKVIVGDGVATPALVGGKLYVFAMQQGNEVLRCLDAATGKVLWQDRYPAQGATGPASSFLGPRASPAVANGKVVTLGVSGTLSCLDAATGKKLWRKDDFRGAVPQFYTSSSPLIVNGLCIAQLGGEGNGGIFAYDLATGKERWRWTGDSPAYGSPTLMTVAGTRLIVTPTASKLVAVGAADGKLAWEAPIGGGRGPGSYNAVTPIVDGQTLFYVSARGAWAGKMERQRAGFAAKDLWFNQDVSAQFSTPVFKGGKLYGLSQRNELFCINAQNGRTAWIAPAGPVGGGPGAGPRGGPGGGRFGRGGFGRGRGGYGSIVDAGSVLLALTPASELIVFQPNERAYTEKARIKVAETPTHAYPVLTGNRLYVKDQDSVTLWNLP